MLLDEESETADAQHASDASSASHFRRTLARAPMLRRYGQLPAQTGPIPYAEQFGIPGGWQKIAKAATWDSARRRILGVLASGTIYLLKTYAYNEKGIARVAGALASCRHTLRSAGVARGSLHTAR